MGHRENGFIWDVLDQAIAEVAGEEFQRLRGGLSDQDIAREVNDAFAGLKRLQEGESLDYHNRWVALFYLTWYQPRHINLVYSWLHRTKAVLPERLHVVDLGCGALVVQFALAFFAATSGQAGARIVMQGVEASRPMTKIGVQLWNGVATIIRESGVTYAKNLNQVMAAMFQSQLGFLCSVSEVARSIHPCSYRS